MRRARNCMLHVVVFLRLTIGPFTGRLSSHHAPSPPPLTLQTEASSIPLSSSLVSCRLLRGRETMGLPNKMKWNQNVVQALRSNLEGMSRTPENMRRLWLAADTEWLKKRIKSYTLQQHNKALVKLAGFEPSLCSQAETHASAFEANRWKIIVTAFHNGIRWFYSWKTKLIFHSCARDLNHASTEMLMLCRGQLIYLWYRVLESVLPLLISFRLDGAVVRLENPPSFACLSQTAL